MNFKSKTLYISFIIIAILSNYVEISGIELPKKLSLGFDIVITNKGIGLGGVFEQKFSSYYYLSENIEIIPIRGKREMVVYDYYTGYYRKLNPRNLLIVPAYIGLKKRLFVDTIDESLIPFIKLSGGGVTALDTPEIGSFFQRWGKLRTYFTLSFYVSLGVDIKYRPKNILTVDLCYNYIRYPVEIDERKNFGGLFIRLTFSVLH